MGQKTSFQKGGHDITYTVATVRLSEVRGRFGSSNCWNLRADLSPWHPSNHIIIRAPFLGWLISKGTLNQKKGKGYHWATKFSEKQDSALECEISPASVLDEGVRV